MKILFCGSHLPDSAEQTESFVSAAGNRFQNNIIRNLRRMGHEVRERSYLGMPLRAETVDLLEKANAGSPDSEDHAVYFIKRGNVASLYRRMEQQLRRDIREADVLLVYNVIHVWFFLPRLAARRGKRSILILADYSGVESYRGGLRRMYARLQLACIRRYFAVVGLSGETGKLLRKQQRFIRMEGGVDEGLLQALEQPDSVEQANPEQTNPEQDSPVQNRTSPYTVLYSGLLSEATGVDLLLGAFARSEDPDLRLVLTGKGPLQDRVERATSQDPRICYRRGLSYEEYLQQLRTADILVNPRNMELAENQNNFPSKIMEYLASGKPILSTRFVGWEKFREEIFFCDCSAKALAEELHSLAARLKTGEIDPKTVYERNRTTARDYEWKRQLERILKETLSG